MYEFTGDKHLGLLIAHLVLYVDIAHIAYPKWWWFIGSFFVDAEPTETLCHSVEIKNKFPTVNLFSY